MERLSSEAVTFNGYLQHVYYIYLFLDYALYRKNYILTYYTSLNLHARMGHSWCFALIVCDNETLCKLINLRPIQLIPTQSGKYGFAY